MWSKIILLSLILIALSNRLSASDISDIVVSSMDKAIIEAKLDKFGPDKSLPMGDLVLKIGFDFLNTPYVAKILDKTKEEKLVVNLHQLDCTTFAEICLALARTVKSNKSGPETFYTELESIRYRGGKMNGYTSRLHYFSEWISDNEVRRHVRSMAAEMGGKLLPITLNFMSTHPQEYPQLINDPAATALIKETEEKVSAQKHYYIPLDQVEKIEGMVRDGDIVTLTTSIPGIDVSHVGILLKKDGRVYMLHASSSIRKVVVSSEPLTQYLAKSKKTTGVMIARPLD